METVFRLPDLGEGLVEAELVTWHVAVGDTVSSSQPLCSIETDKAIVEVPSPHSGRIEKLFVEAGGRIRVGDPLVAFDTKDTPARKDRGGSVLEIPESTTGPRHREAARAIAAPGVRELARSLGVDLDTIKGTGPGGAIMKSDVDAAAPEAAETGQRLRGVRRAMMLNMRAAGREAVASSVTDEADISTWSAGEDTTVRLVGAIVAGCRASPSLNAWFDARTEMLRQHRSVHLGIALETDDGLFVPVIRDVETLRSEEVRRELEIIKADVAGRSIAKSALRGATFTLSNFGMFGGRFVSLVIVPPQVGILGAGQARERVVASNGAPALRRMLPLSLSFDHRVVTGLEALRFLNAAKDALEERIPAVNEERP